MKPFEYVKDEGGISFLGYVQRWTERLVHGCNIFCQSFRKWQLGRWGLASLPWQHNSGEFQNHASLLDQLCICNSLKAGSYKIYSLSHLVGPLLVDGLLAGDALDEAHVVQLALSLVLHPLPLLRLGLQTRNDRPQRLHLLPDLKLHSH